MSETTGGIENSIRAAYDRLPDIQARRKTSRLMKWLLPLVVLAIVVVGLMSLWGAARANVVDRKDELTSHFQARMNLIVPRVERQARQTAEHVLPRLQEELSTAQQQASSNLDETLEKHTSGMGVRLEARMNTQLDDALGTVQRRQRAKLVETFPDLLKCTAGDTPQECQRKGDDLDRLMEEIERSYRDWAIQEMRTTFNGHFEAMSNIRGTMAQFTRVDAQSDDAQSTTAVSTAPSDMLLLFIELTAEYVGGASGLFEAAPGEGGSAK